jgi:hypothetical protein
MTVRPKGVCFRCTHPKVSEGQHQPIINDELWQRCIAVRASRRVTVKTIKKTVRINLLQGLVVCSQCGRRLQIQTPGGSPTYYREDSRLRGYQDCSYSGQSVHADEIDSQVVDLIRSIRFPDNWAPIVRQIVDDQREKDDPETERKDIRGMLRLMRENFEHGLYEGEEYQFWQKVSGMKEKLAPLERVPESAINRTANTLLDLRETWKNSTQEERNDLVHVMIQEVGCDVAAEKILWLKVRLDYESLFTLMEGLHCDGDRRYWIGMRVTQEDTSGVKVKYRHERTGVKTFPALSDNVLTNIRSTYNGENSIKK